MKVLAYLGFTLLSILVQFCVVDLTREKNNVQEEQVKLNPTSQKKGFEDLLKTFTQKPHALYYRTEVNNKLKDSNTPVNRSVRNVSAQEMDSSTVMSSTIIEELYDENSSTTEDSFTTESLYTTTEFDNITEISIFEKKNQSATKPGIQKKTVIKDCICNLLYEVCDINCCCDSDCSESERNLFIVCKDISKKREYSPQLCYPYQYFSGEQDNLIENLFCVVKTNLPEKRSIQSKKYDVNAVSHSYKWNSLSQPPQHTEFERKPYVYGDPVWVLKERSIWYIDTPFPTVNNYCSGRKPILFLNNIDIKCIVSIKDLEMFQILKTSKEASCISVTEKSLNSTALNCSTLHCTNWTTIICDDIICVEYNKSKHEPSCTETYCTNIALKIEYLFYYYESKIMNATIKLYTQNIASHLPYMTQEISVKFVLTNKSIDKLTEMSGNPGYIHGRPLISSIEENNRTTHFFNTTSLTTKYLLHPSNNNGICTFSITEPELVLFGWNTRLKCRFVYNKRVRSENSTETCNAIESNIEQVFGIIKKTYVSPYGNPSDIKDSAWVPVQININEKEITYGQFSAKSQKLRCYNMITRISYIFTFADVSERTTKRVNKIISAEVRITTENITFNIDDVSAVLTIDINFIDGTKPRMYEYAAGPYISVHLPKDFFFPFRSSGSYISKCQRMLLILVCNVMYQQIK